MEPERHSGHAGPVYERDARGHGAHRPHQLSQGRVAPDCSALCPPQPAVLLRLLFLFQFIFIFTFKFILFFLKLLLCYTGYGQVLKAGALNLAVEALDVNSGATLGAQAAAALLLDQCCFDPRSKLSAVEALRQVVVN